MKKISAFVMMLLAAMLTLSGCVQNTSVSTEYSITNTDYSDPSNWAYYETDKEGQADVFFISPTSCYTQSEEIIAPVNEDNNQANLGSINMEKGIYESAGRFFAPYYNQLSFEAYTVSEEKREKAADLCYQDVKAAFDYYMENENNGRPILIAGFSQGAEHGLRLVGEYSENESFREQLVAAYLIGWRITDEDLEKYPYIQLAQGETDTGVVVCFECEADFVTDTIIVPENTFTYSINPLNWKTDSTPAEKEENLGACFTDYDGNISSEIPQLCGARIDPDRGTIKVDDVTASDYPAVLDIFPEGCYHIYDYQFYYRNLQENVAVRLNQYVKNS